MTEDYFIGQLHPMFKSMLILNKLSLLLLTCIVFSIVGCVREEVSESAPESPRSSLDEIRAQLDRPLKKNIVAQPTTAQKEKVSRWKALTSPQSIQKPEENAIDPQKLLFDEVYQAQDQASWPPQVGQQFPIMPMLSPNAEKRMTDSFRGRVTLIEYASMKSAATQALAGSGERGPYGAVNTYPPLKVLESYFPAYSSGIQASDINRVQILMVDLRSQIVTPALAKAWSEHFELEGKRGRIVLIASAALLQGSGSDLIGGFQLLDKNMFVRGDATGARSKTLFSGLFPLMTRFAR
jgi:cell division protein FtsL